METFVTAVFPTKDQAIGGQKRLLQLSEDGSVVVERAAVYGRQPDGDLGPVDLDTSVPELLDLSNLPGSTGQEVLDELDTAMPDAAYALVAHLIEHDGTVVDSAMVACGGTVYRRPISDLQHDAYVRFMDASKL